MPGIVGENVKLATTVGEVAEMVIGLEVVADCPMSFVTVNVTAYVPACENRWVGRSPEPLGDPSPKSQVKVPVLGLDAEASKNTS